MNKYHNIRIENRYGTFDSKKEFERYLELLSWEKAGIVHNLQRQVKYELIPAQREPDVLLKSGKMKPGKVIEKEVAYYADFVYENSSGETIVEDTKGVKTKEYIIKRKLMLYRYGIRIREV